MASASIAVLMGVSMSMTGRLAAQDCSGQLSAGLRVLRASNGQPLNATTPVRIGEILTITDMNVQNQSGGTPASFRSLNVVGSVKVANNPAVPVLSIGNLPPGAACVAAPIGGNSGFRCTGGAGTQTGPVPAVNPSCLPFNSSYTVTFADIAASQLTLACTVPPPAGTILFKMEGSGVSVLENMTPAGVDASGCGSVAIPVIFPCITVTKECVNPCTPIGQAIQFRGTVRNTGNNSRPDATGRHDLIGITLVDNPPATIVFATTTSLGNPFPADGQGPNNRLRPGESVNYTGSYTPTGNPCGPFTDTITATATVASLGAVTISNTDPCIDAVTGQSTGPRPPVSATCHVITAPAIDLTKTCGPVNPPCDNRPNSVKPGENYFEEFVVRNTGNVALRNVVIRDTINGVTTTIPVTGSASCPQLELQPNTSCTIRIIKTAPANSCDPITDRAIASGDQVCPPDATCPSPATVNSAERSCTVVICCPPCIRITEEVVCVKSDGGCELFTPEENDQTNACGFRNEDRSQCSAFCFKIKIENRCIDGSIPPEGAIARNIRVTCSDPRVSLASCNFPTTLAPGEMFMCQVGPITLCDDLVNTVCVTADGVTPEPDDTDSVGVQIKPIAVSCVSTFTSSIDMDGLVDNCVTLPSSTTPQPVTLKTTISNDSDVDLLVTVSGLPALVECGDQTTPVVVGVIAIPARGTHDVNGCYLATCPPQTTFDISVSGTVNTNVANNDCTCYYDINRRPITTTRNANDNCPVCIKCEQPVECRTTGGGQLIPGFVDQSCIPVVTQIFPSAGVNKITHGGQLGAPFSQMDCGTVLGNPCIRGQWQHTRHYQGNGNPRDVIDMNFHTVTPKGVFDTLSCACLGCCDPTTGAFIPPVVGPMIHKFALCNPDDHKMCGPQPRPAPANSLIFSGIGRITPEDDISGPRANRSEWVIFRIYIEDRSEPGGGHPDPSFPTEPADIYCFQAWKTGIKTTRKPDFTNVSTAFRMALGEDSCEYLRRLEVYPAPLVRDDGTVLPPLPPGSLPSDTVNGATADIRDCGPLHDGNRQIHPATGATCTQ